MDNLEIKLGSFMGTVIESFTIDVLGHEITIAVKFTRDSVELRKTIVFSGVSAYYFQANQGDERRNLTPPEENNVLEIMEILYYPNRGLGKLGFLNTEDILAKSWTSEYKAVINFVVEMLDDCLFIEADCVRIDDEMFEIGYPVIV